MTAPPVTSSPPAEPRAQSSEPNDLGFGSVVGRANEKRLLNRDGSFNSRRRGLNYLSSLSAYNYLLTMSWPSFFLGIAGAYAATNALFAVAFMLCGPSGMTGPVPDSVGGDFAKAFFFSVHTLATIGYGNIVPNSLAANLVVSAESLVGLLGFALATGILFARFSRPIAVLIFSDHAVIAPYRDHTAFMFRVVNGRTNQLVELQATVLFSCITSGVRKYSQLTLERTGVVFFPLSWTLVHPINDQSPLWGLSASDLAAADAEIMILISGTDETFAQTVHARSSYKPHEVLFSRRFVGIYNPVSADGIVSIDVRRLSETEAVDR